MDFKTFNTDLINLYVRDLKNYPPLSKEENITIAKQYQETKSQRLHDKMVVGNLRLTFQLSKQFQNLFPLETCVSIANEALIKAVNTYNPTIGAFSTYLLTTITMDMLNNRLKDKTIKENHQMIKQDYYYGQQHTSTDTVIKKESGFTTTVGDNLPSDSSAEFEFDSNVNDIIWNEVKNECLNPSVKRRGNVGADGVLQPYHIVKGVFAEKEHKVTCQMASEMYGVSNKAVGQTKNILLRKLKNNKKLKQIWENYET